MSDGRNFGQTNQDPAEAARRALERLQGKPTDSSSGTTGINSLDVLRQNVLGGGQRRSPWDNPVELPPTDKPPERPPAPVNKGVLEVTYGEAGFDAKIAQNNYTKLVIKGLPKDLAPSPWVDEESGKGFFFWLKNQKNPDASDRNKHYFPSNLKEIEIAQYQGNIYKPVMIKVDEMRIAASQAYMRKQNDSGFASYKNATDAYTYAANMSKIAGGALGYQESLLRQGAEASPDNPYFRIYLADVLAAQAIQPVLEKIARGETAYFDNPETRKKVADALTEVRLAKQITRQYGDIMKPPAYEMPLSPFSLNPYSYNPDYYWSGAAYQASIREMQLGLLQTAIINGSLAKLQQFIQLPPDLPPRP